MLMFIILRRPNRIIIIKNIQNKHTPFPKNVLHEHLISLENFNFLLPFYFIIFMFLFTRNTVYDIIDDEDPKINRHGKKLKQMSLKKDTGYSTASESDTSHALSMVVNETKKTGKKKHMTSKANAKCDGGKKMNKSSRRTDDEAKQKKRAVADDIAITDGQRKHSKRKHDAGPSMAKTTRRRHSSSDETRYVFCSIYT